MKREIPFGRPILGEEEKAAVAAVLGGHILSHGPKVKEFEETFACFTGAPFAVGTSSATAALHLACFRLGLRPNDEVLVPAQTHVATAHAVELCGAKPVFVDSEEATGNLDLEAAEAAITENTKAVSVVHYLGMPVDMRRVMDMAKRRGLFVIEDCALAIGTRLEGVHAGLWGDVGCFSFYPVKHITTGEGGMLVTRHKAVATDASQQRAFGIDRNIVSERKVPGLYDVVKLGFNYRMNEVAAALGVEQMKRVEGFLKRRKENHDMLTRALGELDELDMFDSSHGEFQSSYYCHSVRLRGAWAARRDRVVEALTERGIGTSVYYPKPLPEMTYYAAKYGYRPGQYPVASRISSSSIALPVGPHLSAEDMSAVAAEFKEALQEAKGS